MGRIMAPASCGNISEAPCLVRKSRCLSIQNCGAFCRNARNAPDQIRVPALTSRVVFIEDCQDALEPIFKRGVSGLHGMHESHAGGVSSNVRHIKATAPKKRHGIPEMPGRIDKIIFNLKPSIISHQKSPEPHG